MHLMMKTCYMPIAYLWLLVFLPGQLVSQQQNRTVLPVRGLAIAAPQNGDVDKFIAFMDQVLAPRGVNVLILRVDYNYAYESHPELRDEEVLSRTDVKKSSRRLRIME